MERRVDIPVRPRGPKEDGQECPSYGREAQGFTMAVVTPERPPVFNLPNQLTAARFGLAIVLFVLIELGLWIACIIVFAVAAFTDWLDGYIARKQGLISSLGRNLDPLVDKVLVCGAFIFLLPRGADSGLY